MLAFCVVLASAANVRRSEEVQEVVVDEAAASEAFDGFLHFLIRGFPFHNHGDRLNGSDGLPGIWGHLDSINTCSKNDKLFCVVCVSENQHKIKKLLQAQLVTHR